MGSLFLFNHRLPPIPFNLSKRLHYNVQQILCIEANEAHKTPAVCSPAWPFTCNCKLHRCYRDQWGGMISCPASMHPLIIIPILNPVVSLELFEKDMAVHYNFILLDPQDTISRLQFGHQSRRTAVCCIQRSWEIWHRCLSASSHGMQACCPEARGKRQSFVLISVNNKLLKTLRKHVELLQLRK